jgi:hypothetical protein
VSWRLVAALQLLSIVATTGCREAPLSQVVGELEARPSWLFGSERCPAEAIGPVTARRSGVASASCGTNPAGCLARCKADVADACYWLALAVQSAKAPVFISERLYYRACELGDASGCTNRGAGILEESRKDDRPSRACAARTFRAACDRGDPWGCSMLAEALANGDGVPRDLSAALKALEGSCTFGPDDTACQAALRLRARLEKVLAPPPP